MERRTFLQSGIFLAGFCVGARSLFAAQQCGQVFLAPTPYGPHQMQQCEAGIESITFQQAFQEHREWCWAASISMVFGYYHHPVDQQRIVKETWGQVADMPAQPSDIVRDLNRSWVDDNGRKFQSFGDVLSTNANTAVQDLQANHPIIVGALGHATVLTALVTTIDLATSQWAVVQAIVRDPWPANGGKRVLSPVEWGNIAFAARIRLTSA